MGDSHYREGILQGALLVVDSSLTPVDGSLLVCAIEEEYRIKRYRKHPRRFRRAPYEFGEYIALLSRQDDALVRWRIKSISRKRCGKCGERVPVNSCPCNGDSQCWVTKG
ncbi:hypothetical protein D9741_17585 [Escherichia sp. E14V7]|uniref:hypothetical protein n=1 Tax=unclassified Escherichia TaxID=2608889 RepID=UPI00102A2130|nr:MULTISPECIES: hypothetical protein [unclassified Escherichia]WFW63028.1 hypothetical protein NFJ77_12675 [Escherichia coli]RZM96060.1 hypothetical protein D9740_09350 [Escherichia sp. E14V5]RZN01578.1 hypothetical protein D9741_17585 [Escherichia sp. E14V7]RZN25466.1 hypothetical protein D9739_16425 [Escherichia sp. E14V10]TGB61291.1 hypothetical protein CRT22_02805 [Escherichia sp. E5028]